MSDTPKSIEILNIPTKTGTATNPGRTLESEAERLLRYQAQVIAEKEGISLLQAMEIAKVVAKEEERQRRAEEFRRAKAEKLELERLHDQKKRDGTPLYRTHGLPLEGGLPGLGKNQ